MSASYVVRIAFVDDSYWDDGSRWTSQTFHFKGKAEAVAFARKAVTEGCTFEGQNGEVRARPDARDIAVEVNSTRRVKWEPSEGE